MSRARNIPADLHKVADLASTAADVANKAAVSADKAQHAADKAHEVRVQVTDASRGKGRGLLVLLLLAGLAAVGFVIWKKSTASSSSPDDVVTDLRAGAPDFAGSMP
jgi:uncharacterized protein HemX